VRAPGLSFPLTLLLNGCSIPLRWIPRAGSTLFTSCRYISFFSTPPGGPSDPPFLDPLGITCVETRQLLILTLWTYPPRWQNTFFALEGRDRGARPFLAANTLKFSWRAVFDPCGGVAYNPCGSPRVSFSFPFSCPSPPCYLGRYSPNSRFFFVVRRLLCEPEVFVWVFFQGLLFFHFLTPFLPTHVMFFSPFGYTRTGAPQLKYFFTFS